MNTEISQGNLKLWKMFEKMIWNIFQKILKVFQNFSKFDFKR